MSAVKTLQIRIVNPIAERLIGDLASQNLIEIDEPELADNFDVPQLVPAKPSKLPFGRGCMKGKMWMADDFDAPLEDFKEYVETLPENVPKMSREEMFGCMQGQFEMADDFDAPLDDFKEYME